MYANNNSQQLEKEILLLFQYFLRRTYQLVDFNATGCIPIVYQMMPIGLPHISINTNAFGDVFGGVIADDTYSKVRAHRPKSSQTISSADINETPGTENNSASLTYYF